MVYSTRHTCRLPWLEADATLRPCSHAATATMRPPCAWRIHACMHSFTHRNGLLLPLVLAPICWRVCPGPDEIASYDILAAGGSSWHFGRYAQSLPLAWPDRGGLCAMAILHTCQARGKACVARWDVFSPSRRQELIAAAASQCLHPQPAILGDACLL